MHMDRVHHGSGHPVRHGQRGEARMVVYDIEWPAGVSCTLDLLPRTRDVIALVERRADLVGMGSSKQRMHARRGR